MKHGMGLGFALFIIGALLAAFLALRQFQSVPQNSGSSGNAGDEQTAVQETQGLVDDLNRRNEEILEELN